jgi:hypothetical protein
VIREEIIKLMSVLRGAYPQFYRDVSKTEALDTINLWADMFANDDAALVGAAVKSLIEGDEKGFPPTIGQIKAKIRLLTGSRELTESEAWARVAAAVRNGIYNSQEEFDKLSPTMQRIVGSPAQLREWATMDSQTLHSVVASNFQRSYKAISAKEQEIAKLPADVRQMVAQIAPPKLEARYESHEEAVARLEADHRKGWEQVRKEEDCQRRRKEEIIAWLRK